MGPAAYLGRAQSPGRVQPTAEPLRPCNRFRAQLGPALLVQNGEYFRVR